MGSYNTRNRTSAKSGGSSTARTSNKKQSTPRDNEPDESDEDLTQQTTRRSGRHSISNGKKDEDSGKATSKSKKKRPRSPASESDSEPAPVKKSRPAKSTSASGKKEERACKTFLRPKIDLSVDDADTADAETPVPSTGKAKTARTQSNTGAPKAGQDKSGKAKADSKRKAEADDDQLDSDGEESGSQASHERSDFIESDDEEMERLAGRKDVARMRELLKSEVPVPISDEHQSTDGSADEERERPMKLRRGRAEEPPAVAVTDDNAEDDEPGAVGEWKVADVGVAAPKRSRKEAQPTDESSGEEDIGVDRRPKKKSKQQEKIEFETPTFDDDEADGMNRKTSTAFGNDRSNAQKNTTLEELRRRAAKRSEAKKAKTSTSGTKKSADPDDHTDAAKVKSKSKSKTDGSSSADTTPAEFVLVLGNDGPPLKKQSPVVQRLARAAIDHVIADVLFSNAYPDICDTPMLYCRKAILKCAKKIDSSDLYAHCRGNTEWMDRLGAIPDSRVGSLRSNLKKASDELCPVAFGLRGLAAPAVQAQVASLLQNHSYTFARRGAKNIDTSRPFANPALVSLLASTFFEGKKSLAAKYAKRFASSISDGERSKELEVPAPMAALTATAMYASLQQWKDGKLRAVRFESDMFHEVYLSIIKFLQRIEAQNADAYHRMMANLYNSASESMGPSSVTFEDDDAVAIVDFAGMET